MSEFKKKQKSTFWHSPLFLGVLFVILVLFSYNIIDLISKERETSIKRDRELDNIETLRQRETSLSKSIERINTEEGIEEVIREKYQVVKPGEKEVIIVDKEEKKEDLGETTRSHGFWGFVKRIFGFDNV
jgi:cell division protein FtsB